VAGAGRERDASRKQEEASAEGRVWSSGAPGGDLDRRREWTPSAHGAVARESRTRPRPLAAVEPAWPSSVFPPPASCVQNAGLGEQCETPGPVWPVQLTRPSRESQRGAAVIVASLASARSLPRCRADADTCSCACARHRLAAASKRRRGHGRVMQQAVRVGERASQGQGLRRERGPQVR
jgi:hypothetical protein